MTSERYYDYYGGDYAVYPRRVQPRRQRRPVRRGPLSYAFESPRAYGWAAEDSRASGAVRPAQRSGNARPAGRSANQKSRQSSAPRPPKGTGRQSARMPMIAILVIAALLLGLAAFGAVKLLGKGGGSGGDRFVDNVYVNGICLTGLTHDEGVQLMHEKRDEWLNTVYPLSFEGHSYEFTPADVNARLELDDNLEKAWSLGHIGDRESRRMIVETLRQTPAEFVSEPTFDEAAVDAFVEKIAQEVYKDPIDAEVTLTDLKPVITRPSEIGWELDKEQLKANLIGAIETGKCDSALPIREIEPVVASDNMEMRIIAKCETDVTFRGYPSRTNVRLALERFNLMAVYPGDKVSFNEVVGPRTEAAGYQRAPEYAGSTKEMGIGGGVCQASTTLYNAMIQSGMTIIERHRHTMTVSYVDPSLDAAVNYGKKDLVFRNDTDHAIYIYTNVTKELATVTVYGTRPEYHYELESRILSERRSEVVGYQDDVEGKHVYYITDEPVLYKEGRGSCESEGWIVSYDWQTGTEVERVQISHDVYSPGVNVYWRGVHAPDGSVVTTPEPATF